MKMGPYTSFENLAADKGHSVLQYNMTIIAYTQISLSSDVKRKNRLIKHLYVFANVTNKQSAPSFSKTALSIFQLKSDC